MGHLGRHGSRAPGGARNIPSGHRFAAHAHAPAKYLSMGAEYERPPGPYHEYPGKVDLGPFQALAYPTNLPRRPSVVVIGKASRIANLAVGIFQPCPACRRATRRLHANEIRRGRQGHLERSLTSESLHARRAGRPWDLAGAVRCGRWGGSHPSAPGAYEVDDVLDERPAVGPPHHPASTMLNAGRAVASYVTAKGRTFPMFNIARVSRASGRSGVTEASGKRWLEASQETTLRILGRVYGSGSMKPSPQGGTRKVSVSVLPSPSGRSLTVTVPR